MYLSNNKYKIMKKIVIVLFLFIGIATFAQSVTGSPSGYTVIDENVELIIDVTGATDNDGNSIEGKDLYIYGRGHLQEMGKLMEAGLVLKMQQN